MFVRQLHRLLCILFSLFPFLSFADSINIAVTASFKPVMDQLAQIFESQSGTQLNISSASTGILTQQILAGAPFDIFFSADADRPMHIADVLKLPIDRVETYAIGTLVLISDDSAVKSVEDLSQYSGKVILANPKLAPYGVAAESVLDQVHYSGARIQANNVVQARQYLSLKLAKVGLIAKSVALELSPQYEVSETLYEPIVQKRLLLKESTAAKQLLTFLESSEAVELIQRFGYQVPVR